MTGPTATAEVAESTVPLGPFASYATWDIASDSTAAGVWPRSCAILRALRRRSARSCGLRKFVVGGRSEEYAASCVPGLSPGAGLLVGGGCADLDRFMKAGFGVVGTGGFVGAVLSSGVGERWDASESDECRIASTEDVKDALDANSGERGVYVGDVRSMKDSESV